MLAERLKHDSKNWRSFLRRSAGHYYLAHSGYSKAIVVEMTISCALLEMSLYWRLHREGDTTGGWVLYMETQFYICLFTPFSSHGLAPAACVRSTCHVYEGFEASGTIISSILSIPQIMNRVIAFLTMIATGACILCTASRLKCL